MCRKVISSSWTDPLSLWNALLCYSPCFKVYFVWCKYSYSSFLSFHLHEMSFSIHLLSVGVDLSIWSGSPVGNILYGSCFLSQSAPGQANVLVLGELYCELRMVPLVPALESFHGRYDGSGGQSNLCQAYGGVVGSTLQPRLATTYRSFGVTWWELQCLLRSVAACAVLGATW